METLAAPSAGSAPRPVRNPLVVQHLEDRRNIRNSSSTNPQTAVQLRFACVVRPRRVWFGAKCRNFPHYRVGFLDGTRGKYATLQQVRRAAGGSAAWCATTMSFRRVERQSF